MIRTDDEQGDVTPGKILRRKREVAGMSKPVVIEVQFCLPFNGEQPGEQRAHKLPNKIRLVDGVMVVTLLVTCYPQDHVGERELRAEDRISAFLRSWGG